jgi:hypothetical protein
MATIVHLEGTDFVINLDQVIAFDKTVDHEAVPELAEYYIKFESVKGDLWAWEFESREQRDKVFLALVHMDKGRVFKPAEEKGLGSTGPVFL